MRWSNGRIHPSSSSSLHGHGTVITIEVFQKRSPLLLLLHSSNDNSVVLFVVGRLHINYSSSMEYTLISSNIWRLHLLVWLYTRNFSSNTRLAGWFPKSVGLILLLFQIQNPGIQRNVSARIASLGEACIKKVRFGKVRPSNTSGLYVLYWLCLAMLCVLCSPNLLFPMSLFF